MEKNLKKRKNAVGLAFFLFVLLSVILYSPFFFQFKLPFPGDVIIGGYHPWRDVIWEGRTAGYPLKNLTISDAVTQFYPWRFLAIEQLKRGEFPFWNIHEFSGTPLFASLSTGTLYPLNLIFFFLPFSLGWGIQVVLQPILAGFFTFLFLRAKKISSPASIFGSLTFAFSSFIILQSEFLVSGHAALWLPLALLSVEKLRREYSTWWFFLLITSLSFSMLAGFLQVTLYVFLIVFLYALFTTRLKKSLITILAGIVLSFLLLAFQLLPFLELWINSSRSLGYHWVGEAITRFFIPLENLVMFFAPDFFGNPATLNYYGQPNYYEFNGYFGITSLFLAMLAALLAKKGFKERKEVLFWFFLVSLGLLFSTRNFLSEVPYKLKIPVWVSLVPARAIFISQFSLAILASFGVDFLRKVIGIKNGKLVFVLIPLIIVIFALVFLWLTCFLFPGYFPSLITPERVLIAKRNLILPSLNVVALTLLLGISAIKKKSFTIVLVLLFLILSFDLVHQGRKFLPSIDSSLAYPDTKITKFLKDQKKPFRFMPTHQELFPTNSQIMYQLESVEGYNPLVLNRYSNLISAAEGEALGDRSSFRFQRTVYTREPSLDIYDFLNVRYVLALENLNDQKLQLLFQEGETRIYENQEALPRAFIVYDIEVLQDESSIVDKLIQGKFDFSKKVILEENPGFLPVESNNTDSKSEIVSYKANKVIIKTNSEEEGILAVSDNFYPGWRAFVDGRETKIYRANYNFRAVFVPGGEHEVRFIFQPQSFKIGLKVSVLTFLFLIAFSTNEIIKSRSSSSKRHA